MQPPPRSGPPGATGPPPSAAGPNVYRRIRPHKHTAAATASMGPPPSNLPMTDPFAFVRAPAPVPPGGFPPTPSSNPPPTQAPSSSMSPQPGPGMPPQPQFLEGATAAPGPTPPSLSGMTLFTPNSAASPAVLPTTIPQIPRGYSSSHTEQAYFNSREQASGMATRPPPVTTVHGPSHIQQPGPPPQMLPFQPVHPISSPSSSQWAPDHGSRPPSVQNYFQPTSDPPPQPYNIPQQSQTYPSHRPSPRHNTPTPPIQPCHPQTQAPHPNQNQTTPQSSQWPDSNAPHPPNAHLQSQSYFSQSSAPQDSWFSQHQQDSGYHQMGSSVGSPQFPPDFPHGSPHVSTTGHSCVNDSATAPVPYSQESSTLSMFFKDSDVENEETLAGDGKMGVNGIPGSFQPHSNLQSVPHPQCSQADMPLEYQGASHLPYMSDGNHSSLGNNQNVEDSQHDHFENLECVQNQEVLPNEVHSNSAAVPASHSVDQFETGPNLETPDMIPRPMRSASVSSSFSNVSHGSGTSSRRHQGVVGTFIQQESPRPADDTNPTSATGGYFEQIDTAPGSDVSVPQSPLEPPTPSPPKPTGIFQASANSSFEPVRSHGVGVRPVEFDKAKMVAEGGSDSVPGNLEQPPDNVENIYGSGQPLPAVAGGGAPHVTPPVVHNHSRPSSRAHVASRPCESPATTLWAQNDPTSLGVNVLLAPAAPTLLAPLREASADVIQPPEDAPLDLQPTQRAQQSSHQLLENLENPPMVSEGESDSQANPGYASLLVSDSPQQPVMIAPPVSNYSVISTSAQPVRPQGQNTSVSQKSLITSNHNSLFTPGSGGFNSSSSSQGPLNLTREKIEGPAVVSTTPLQSQPVCPPVSRGQSLSGDSNSALHHTQTPLAAAAISDQNPPSNFELLDFSMHQSQTPNQAPGCPPSHESPQSSNAPGFYLQVTKDAQQGGRAEEVACVHTPTTLSSPQAPSVTSQTVPNIQRPPSETSHASQSMPPPQSHHVPKAALVTGGQTSTSQYPSTAQAPVGGNVVSPSAAPFPVGPPGPVPPGTSQPSMADPPRPPSTAGSQQGYGPPPPGPGQMYGDYYRGSYGEYQDGRAPYFPGQYPPGDPRAQHYYDGSYRSRSDPWYGRYDGSNPVYREPNYQPERPSSRTSQYSDRPSSRQGYPDDYSRTNRSAYNEYYADYAKHYDYAGYNSGSAYDPRYRGYYDQLWYNYDDNYRGRDGYYNQHAYSSRKDGFDDQWRYYPGYDASFDDDYRRRGEVSGDDFDRRSIHSEQSAHSVHSSHSQHSRRSSFSSRSQQSQMYRSQPDLVSAVYDTTASTLAVDYSYGQFPDQTDVSQNYGQYLYPSEYTTDSTWIAPEQPPPRPATPEKFTMPHRCARFGPSGHLVQVLPNLPSAGQPALVDVFNLETLLQNTPDQAELRAFPGPLVKDDTHKVDVIKFSQNKALECSRDNNLLDRDSARLLWDFIMLLCRQNGTVVGTDLADLLLREHRSVWLPGKSPNEANLIDFNNEPLAQAEEELGSGPISLLSDTVMTVPENFGKETERFRELLLFGRKKDALEAGMKAGLWGHALLLASKMDSRTHARVMTRFANSLPINDPLQTVYQLMSGRMPASATCCGEEKWGDWRPHLAMVLSNLTYSHDLDTRTITTMGDTLASKGLIDAAHFCYLMAQVGLGVFTKKSTKMVLIGSNHSLSFSQFATNEAIQRTEAYEYAQSLGSQHCSLPNFQVFKLIYACRLAEAGMSAQAYHYCEIISRTVLRQPSYYSPVLVSQLIQISEKLRFFDPQLKERPEEELYHEPEWLIHLRQLNGQIRTGVVTYNSDRATPTQFTGSSQSSDIDESCPAEPYNMPVDMDGPAPDNPLMSSLLPGSQGVQLMPPAPTTVLQGGMIPSETLPPGDVPMYYPVPPSTAGPAGHIPVPGYPPQDSGFAPPPVQPQHQPPDMYPASLPQPGPSPPGVSQMSPYMPPLAQHHPGQMIHPPPQMQSHMPPSPGHMPVVDQPFQAPSDIHATPPLSSSPRKNSMTPQMDLYDHMAHMGPGRRSRTTSQSSMHMASGRHSCTPSESSTHSGGRERSSSIKQVSPPPPPIPEQPRKEEAKAAAKDSSKKGSGDGGRGGWIGWIMRKTTNTAHLPDDKIKSIVYDHNKQRWVNLDEPEEESKPPPPPPSGFPKMTQPPGGPAAPPCGGPPVNMFSRKAGTKSRYVDVLNPSGGSKTGSSAPAPADMFAPLAPMPMPANLFVPSSVPDDQSPVEGSEGGSEQSSVNTAPQMFNPTLLPPAPEVPTVPDGSQSGELSRSSSMSSLSREVSQHLNQNHSSQGPAPTGGITFYNPAQFAQTSAPPGGGVRSGRLGGQRQYPVMK